MDLIFDSTTGIGTAFLQALPVYMKEMAMAMLPIVAIFLIFQVFVFKMNTRSFGKIAVGILYTYVGLVLFLAGVNVGFSSLGAELGAALATGETEWLLIPLAMVMGWFIIDAEPAVHILNQQVEELSAGAISARAMGVSLSIAAISSLVASCTTENIHSTVSALLTKRSVASERFSFKSFSPGLSIMLTCFKISSGIWRST